MSKPTTKNDLVSAANSSWEKMNILISLLTEKELSTPFDFSGDTKKERSSLEKG